MQRNAPMCLLSSVAVLIAAACRVEAPVSITPAAAAPSIAARSPQPSPTTRVIRGEDAIRAVLASPGVGGSALFAPFPMTPGSQSCEIQGGGRAPGIVVPGTCRTEVQPTAAGYVVAFTEAWDAARFHFAGEPSSGQLAHTWLFTVSSSGVVGDQSQSGQFPPQEVK